MVKLLNGHSDFKKVSFDVQKSGFKIQELALMF